MQMQIAPNLTQMIRDMAPAHRAPVMRALTSRPRIQGRWFGGDDAGCFWVIATQRVNGISRRHFEKDPEGISATTFGVSRDRVRAVYQEWDGLTPEDLDRWIAGVKAEVQAHVDEAHHRQQSLVRRGIEAARELVRC